MDCKECKSERRNIPFIVHEADMARMERTNRRMWIVIILLIVALIGTNIAWTIYESQFVEEVSTEIEQDADGNGSNYVVGCDYIGEAENHDN